MKKKKVILLSLLIAVALLFGGVGAYLLDYYHADPIVQEIMEQSANQISVLQNEKGELCFIPKDPVTGLIFYPGAKVEYTAYVPLMCELAKNGLLCVLLQTPANIAILGQNAADGIPSRYPYIENWYMAGHSLGGAMAASYAAKHADDFQGLILLASYSTVDMGNTDLDVLSIYGSEDLVLNMENYEANKVNLPGDFSEYIISGGCHAYFGSYGFQKGDGTPDITNEEQIAATVEQILDFVRID